MSLLDHGAFRALQDAIKASVPDHSSVDLCAMVEDLTAFNHELQDEELRPSIVADATLDTHGFPQDCKVDSAVEFDAGQCADASPQHTPYNQHTTPLYTDLRHPEEGEDDGCTNVSHASSQHGGKPGRTISKISSRQPKRMAAQLDRTALNKTWLGTKSKGCKDKLLRHDKLAAAVWSVAASRGVAVSLNLGIRREGMIIEHHNPRRRMMQNLNRHLVAEGFGHLPYAFVFEVTPESDDDRVHMHGVIDTSGLSNEELKRLGDALRQAASPASGALGGERQLDMQPIHDAAGWSDYLLKYSSQTKKSLRLDNPVMMNDQMTRMAKRYFENLQAQVRGRDASINAV